MARLTVQFIYNSIIATVPDKIMREITLTVFFQDLIAALFIMF
jgi:hypothetical protein